MRAIQWPTRGDERVLRRHLLLRGAGTALPVAAAAVAALLTTALSLRLEAGVAVAAVGAVGLALAWSIRTSVAAARCAEVERSFADLVIIHRGHAVHLDRRPVTGSYPTRLRAVRGALAVGSWAVVVEAYGRYWVLAGHRVAAQHRRPVSFRSRAVADVVPSVLRGDQPLSA